MHFSEVSASDLVAKTLGNEVSATEAVQAALSALSKASEDLNAMTLLRASSALIEAEALDRLSPAKRGKLHGVPIAIKDLTPSVGDLTTFGSLAFATNTATHDATVVSRLREAGAVVVAKTTTPEFAHSGFTQSRLWGQTRNPWNLDRTTGGSSGGSAAVVAAGCVPLAEGTDMGGSVRLPASYCGVVGFKPSLGRIPVDILSGCFDTLSHFGPIARTVEDAALFLNVTQGPSSKDIFSQPNPRSFHLHKDMGVLRGKKIALSENLGVYEVADDVQSNLWRVADALREGGATVEEVELGWRPDDTDLWSAMWCVYLACETADIWDASRHQMDPQLVSLVEKGRDMSAFFYKSLEKRRTQMWQGLSRVFDGYHALICPTTCTTAPPISCSDADFGHLSERGLVEGLGMTSLFNLFGQCPALTIPSGVGQDGMPTGVQIIGNRFDDGGVLHIGAAIERLLK